eukprot:Gb_00530 [translate_table: standard]
MADPITWLAGKERIGTSSSSNLIDAKLEERQSGGTFKLCAGCGQKLQCKEAIQDWPGLPAGVKFDPTDQELLEHLEAKVEADGSKPHPLIDEFIPTLEGEDGICYTHPEKLPGVTRDGLNRHFFHRPSKAYTTGTRKRRKIQTECDLQGGETRWHKTGKTRPVMVNGKQKGCKKILVLYTNFGKQRKPEKTNWVMHQYHLGLQEEEKEGELVVSKVFYQTQPRQCNWERAASDTADGSIMRNKIEMTEKTAYQGGDANVRNYTAGAMSKQPMRDANPGSCTHNVDQQQVFSFAPRTRSFDEGISDSGKGSESSHCTPHSCDEHEENERINANTAKRFAIALRFTKGGDPNVELKVPADHQSYPHSCRAGESQDPDEGVHDLQAVIDENAARQLLCDEKLQRQKIAGRPSSSQKLTLEDIFMDAPPEIKEEGSLTNSQDTEWLKYSFWPDSDSAEHQRMI